MCVRTSGSFLFKGCWIDFCESKVHVDVFVKRTYIASNYRCNLHENLFFFVYTHMHTHTHTHTYTHTHTRAHTVRGRAGKGPHAGARHHRRSGRRERHQAWGPGESAMLPPSCLGSQALYSGVELFSISVQPPSPSPPPPRLIYILYRYCCSPPPLPLPLLD